ncbi:MAG: hypothetical protein KDA33_11080, partial [Phycisphaerales bacterium]|nr:hypothetical protein [Phycisphaerales bacterium]
CVQAESPISPLFGDLAAFWKALNEIGVVHALGGSGLFRLLGVETAVNDWDITTDADEPAIAPIVRRYPHQRLPATKTLLSHYAYRLRVGQSNIDLIGGFRIGTDNGPVIVRTIVTGYHEGVPLGCPDEWRAAYRAMGRDVPNHR